jgi:membrane fusion protein (multidrug efflux system)
LGEIQTGQAVTAHTDAYPGQVFQGELSVINPKVDNSTRNVQLRATLKNPQHRLLPGMYAMVEVGVGRPRRYLTLPLTAISFNPYGSTVYLVKEQGKDERGNARLIAQQSFVVTGETRGDQVAVLEGVKEGDVVVTSGQIKLRNGTPIVVNNSVQPSDNPNPRPEEE